MEIMMVMKKMKKKKIKLTMKFIRLHNKRAYLSRV